MPVELRITSKEWSQLLTALLPDDEEHAAVLVCGQLITPTKQVLLVHEVLAIGDDDLDAGSGPLHISILPTTIARLTKQVARDGLSLVVCHSHPFPGVVRPSPLDTRTERDLCGRVLVGRLPGRLVGSLIVGPNGWSARAWCGDSQLEIDELRVVGDRIARDRPYTGDSVELDDSVDRQVRAWGSDGQRSLADSSVVIVGCGGTGSHAAIQLSHLGVGGLVLIDPDDIERSNLSRIVGSTASDVGRPKVDVLADAVRRINPRAVVQGVPKSVLEVDARAYLDADVIVCATDGHGSRALLNQVATQYLVPVVDMGVEIQPGGILRAGGGVRILRPGAGCLQCAGTLDPQLVRQEFLTDDEREVEARRGYLRGVDEPAPSVIALNGVVASLAVLEVCDLLTGFLGSSRSRLLYRAHARALTTADLPRRDDCFVCGSSGVLGVGDAHGLPRRAPSAA
jgi:molybdopterin/thiamine biosynthesis adenylyltransferase